jgi:large subunit ribosomal protein L14e
MPALEVGRICVKTLGREVGKRCVIVDLIDKSFVLITGPQALTGVKRRRANVKHLEITEQTVEIPRRATDDQVTKALSKKAKT